MFTAKLLIYDIMRSPLMRTAGNQSFGDFDTRWREGGPCAAPGISNRGSD